MSISGHTEFINKGDRNNAGRIEDDLNKIEKQGVVMGLVGARFAKPHKMEYEDIMITEKQNIPKNGYGCRNNSNESLSAASNECKLWRCLFVSKKSAQRKKKLQDYRRLWNKFYEDEDHLYSKAFGFNKRFSTSFKPENLFDNVIMKKRFAISFDMLLMEANERALKQHKLAYVHVAGFGLGVWLAAPEEEKIFLASFQQRLKYLLPQLNNIGVIHFSWFRLKECDELTHEAVIKSETHKEGGIKILISKRNPNEKLVRKLKKNSLLFYFTNKNLWFVVKLPPYDNMLPIVSFAWDGNALPGNEFWFVSLRAKCKLRYFRKKNKIFFNLRAPCAPQMIPQPLAAL